MSARFDAPLPLPSRWASLVDVVRDDHIHGASWLARSAAEILAERAREESARIAKARETGRGSASASGKESLNDLAALAWGLAWARPSMAAIANTMTAIWKLALPASLEDLERVKAAAAIGRLRDEAMRLRDSWSHVTTELERHISKLLRDPVFTLSRSGSVEHALIAAASARSPDAPMEVIIAESLPGGEGVDMARALAAAGARVSVVTDSAVGVGMARARTLLLGADSVRSDGSLVNKVGTYPAALVAADLGIPVYALCERLKITPQSYPLTLERVSGAAGEEWKEGGWLFDVTPARLVTAIITEEGALSQEAVARLASDAEVALTRLKNYVERAPARHSQGAHPESASPERAPARGRKPPLRSDSRSRNRLS